MTAPRAGRRLALLLALASCLQWQGWQVDARHTCDVVDCTIMHSHSSVCDSTCQADQRQDLVALHTALHGSAWHNNAGWLEEGVHHCDWNGVVCCEADSTFTGFAGDADDREGPEISEDSTCCCSEHGAVVHIELTDNGLQGHMPSSLPSLSRTVQHFQLGDNAITGTIPAYLGAFEALQTLHLDSNALSGTIPAVLSNATGILVLRLGSNNLTGSIDPQLAQLTSLVWFEARRNRLTGSLPLGLVMLPNMRSLELGYNQLSGDFGEMPEQLESTEECHHGTPNLVLNLQNNSISGSIPPWLRRIPMRMLDLSMNSLTGSMPSFCAELEMLRLSRNKLSGNMPESLGGWLTQELDISHNMLTGHLPGYLGAMGNLAVLRLNHNIGFSGPLPFRYSILVRLQLLDIRATSLQITEYDDEGSPSDGVVHHSDDQTIAANSSNTSAATAASSGSGLPTAQSTLHEAPLPFGMYLEMDEGRTLVDTSRGSMRLCYPLELKYNDDAKLLVDPLFFRFQECICADNGIPQYWDVNGTIVGMDCIAQANMGKLELLLTILLPIGSFLAVMLMLAFVLYKVGALKAVALYKEAQLKRTPPAVGQPVTLVLTDIQGSTELWEWDSALMDEAIDLHDCVLRAYLNKFFGYEVTTEGDAFLLAFHDPSDAVAWCLTVQTALNAAPWNPILLEHHNAAESTFQPPGTASDAVVLFRGLRVRMAVATGVVEGTKRHKVTRRLEYTGQVLRKVQALTDAPHGGQVVLCDDSFRALHMKLPELSASVLQVLGPLAVPQHAASSAHQQHEDSNGHANDHTNGHANGHSQGCEESSSTGAGADSARVGFTSHLRSSLHLRHPIDWRVDEGKESGADTQHAGHVGLHVKFAPSPEGKTTGATAAISTEEIVLDRIGTPVNDADGVASVVLSSSFSSTIHKLQPDKSAGGTATQPLPEDEGQQQQQQQEQHNEGAEASNRNSAEEADFGWDYLRAAMRTRSSMDVRKLDLTRGMFGNVQDSGGAEDKHSKAAGRAAANGANGRAIGARSMRKRARKSSVMGDLFGRVRQLLQRGEPENTPENITPYNASMLRSMPSNSAKRSMGGGKWSAPGISNDGAARSTGGARSSGGALSSAGISTASQHGSTSDTNNNSGIARSAPTAPAGISFGGQTNRSMVDRTAPGSERGVMVIDMGTHKLQGIAEPLHIIQALPPGLENRALTFAPLGTLQQKTPGYFDAPGTRNEHSMLAQHANAEDAGGRAPLPAVTLVFCAIEGYNDMQAANMEAAEELMQQYSDVIRWTLLVACGYECQEQEGNYMIAFAEASDAMEWCLLVQEALMEVNWSARVLELPGAGVLLDDTGMPIFRGPRVRAGIYRGRPTRIVPHTSTGRADYFGPLVNRAARFCHGAAHGGQVLVPKDIVEELVKDWCLIEPDMMPADEGPPWRLRAYINSHSGGNHSWAASMHNFPSYTYGDNRSSLSGSMMEGNNNSGAGAARNSGRASEVPSAGTSGAGVGWETGSRRVMRTASAMAMVTEDAPGHSNNPYIAAVGNVNGVGVSPSSVAARLGRRQSTNDSLATIDGMALSAAPSAPHPPPAARSSFRSTMELMVQMMAQTGNELRRMNSGMARSIATDGTGLSQAPSLGGRSSARLSDSTEAGNSRRPSYLEHGTSRRPSYLEQQQGNPRRPSYLEQQGIRRQSFERPPVGSRRPSRVEYGGSRRSSLMMTEGDKVAHPSGGRSPGMSRRNSQQPRPPYMTDAIYDNVLFGTPSGQPLAPPPVGPTSLARSSTMHTYQSGGTFSMPAHVNGPAALPDISTLFMLRQANARRTSTTSGGGYGKMNRSVMPDGTDLDCGLAASTYTRIVMHKWLWANELLVQELGDYSFKGVTGIHSLVSISTTILAGRCFPLRMRKGKAEQVVLGRGPLYHVVLQPVDTRFSTRTMGDDSHTSQQGHASSDSHATFVRGDIGGNSSQRRLRPDRQAPGPPTLDVHAIPSPSMPSPPDTQSGRATVRSPFEFEGGSGTAFDRASTKRAMMSAVSRESLLNGIPEAEDGNALHRNMQRSASLSLSPLSPSRLNLQQCGASSPAAAVARTASMGSLVPTSGVLLVRMAAEVEHQSGSETPSTSDNIVQVDANVSEASAI